jgi:2-isopropylmalate synthase
LLRSLGRGSLIPVNRTAGRLGGLETMTNDAERQLRLLHDWNLAGEQPSGGAVELDDETLRDGLQSPSVTRPPIGMKLELLHYMEALQIQAADIGYPGAGQRDLADVVALAEEIGRFGLNIKPNCAGRTVAADIEPMAEAQQRSGVPIQASVFLGSSPIRQFVESWDVDFLVRTTAEAVGLARKLDMEVMYVTEDTTRAKPDHLRRVYRAAIEAGATRICLADTVGHATPWGVRNLVRFARELVAETGAPVKIDWHGHRDRGLDVINSLVALAEGADRVHGCALGLGERAGNTPMDLLLINLKLLGWVDADLRYLPDYCRTAAAATGIDIPCNYPAIGKDAFETSTGVHAAAILKAQTAGDIWLTNRIYSGVPADELGREQVVTVGPMSGAANVVVWLTSRGLLSEPETVERILGLAKTSDRVLRDEEIECLLEAPARSGA